MKQQLLFIVCLIFTQQALGIEKLSYRDYVAITTFDGLPSNTVGAITKDSLGFIWIGTKMGLSRFDGCEVQNYPALWGEDIWAIEEFNADTLLIGTVTGAKYFSRRTNIVTKIEIPSTITKAIKKIDHRRFMLCTEAGLYVVEDHIPRRILLDTGLSLSNHVNNIIREDENIFWFATEDGLGRIDTRSMTPVIYRMKENLQNSNFFICLTRINNHIYLGSFNKGLFCFDTTTKVFTKKEGFEYNLIMTIDAQNNHLFIGTNGQGLKTLSLSDGTIEVVSQREKSQKTITSNTITTFLYDNGIQWVGTQFGGVNYTPPSGGKFSYYTKNNFNSTDYRVRSFYMFPNGNKLIGTRTGLFHVEEKTGHIRHYSANNSSSNLRSNIIVFINRIGDKVFIGTYGGGVHIFDEKTLSLKDLAQEEPLLYGCIFRVVQDKTGNLWIASHNGIYHTTPNGHILKKYDTMNSILSTNATFYLYVDDMNRLWIGNKSELLLLDIATGKMQADCFGEPIRGEVNYIMEDSEKDIWVCTTKGLYRIGAGLNIKERFTTDNILPDNHTVCIQEGEPGIYWIATLKEMVHYNSNEKLCYTYQKQDGLCDLEFNNNVFVSNDSIIWWANEGGLINTPIKNPGTKQHFAAKPTITSYSVSAIKYDFPYTDTSKGIILPASNNNIHFCFSNMNYTLPYANVFEYKLEGYDKDWQQKTGVNEVQYTNLPGGNYIFKLQSPGSTQPAQMVTVRVGKSYVFAISLLLVAILITILILFYGYRIWKLKKRIASERTLFSSTLEQSQNKKPTLPQEKAQGMFNNLLAYMEEEKPYLNAKLSISDVAKHLECNETELSQLLNNHMHINFANFVNTYRVNEIKSRMTQENLSKYTLKALSEQCGLNSKTTFHRVFKNVTGMTPLEYCKKQNIIVEENQQ